jgi:O-succinylbenzoic acid--CoA ligase
MCFLVQAVSRDPTRLALDDPGGTLTYQELSETAEGFARGLRASGVGPGDAVALTASLTREALVAFHGIWKAGAAVVPINERWTETERAEAFELLSPTLDLTGAPPLSFLSQVEPFRGPLPASYGGNEVARILTSGTSGRPRIVRVTAANLRASADASRQRLDLGTTDRWLCSLSPSHVGGLALITRASLLGSALVLRGPFNVVGFVGLMEDGSITHASLVPTMLHQVLSAWGERPPPRALRCLLIGGAPARADLVRSALAAGFPIALTYGHPALVRQKPGTVGKPLSGVEVRIDEIGELLVRGPTVAPGQTREDGWLGTGDLAREDGDGDLWIVGRRSDRIISGGVNVDPAEVEQVLESLPGVTAAVVVGVPDPEWGERVVAGVVGQFSGQSLEERHRRARGGGRSLESAWKGGS